MTFGGSERRRCEAAVGSSRSPELAGSAGARRAQTVSNDLLDASQVDRCDARIGVTELTLEDVQSKAFARHFDGVRVAKLMRRKGTLVAEGTGLARLSSLAIAVLNRSSVAWRSAR